MSVSKLFNPLFLKVVRFLQAYEQARSARKRELVWLGYKIHLRDPCDQDPHLPHLIVQVHTVPATTADSAAVEPILSELHEREIAPWTLLVDQGYTSATSLVEQARTRNRADRPAPGVNQRAGLKPEKDMGFTTLRWIGSSNGSVVHKASLRQRWSPFLDRHGTDKIEVRFPPKVCQMCAVREHCTAGTRGRVLKLLPKVAYEALEQRRKEQYTPAFQEAYALRAGIEGTISQATRRTRMRRSPYRGEQKTHLHHVQIAAGINVLRILTHLQAQMQGKPSRA